VSLRIDGGKAEAFDMLNKLQLIDISNNLGDSKTLACHPYSTTHSSLSEGELATLGISPSDIRISVGLEAVEDLITDIETALG